MRAARCRLPLRRVTAVFPAGERGEGLAELTVAMAILALVAMAMLVGLYTSIRTTGRVDGDRSALALARAQVEYVRTRPLGFEPARIRCRVTQDLNGDAATVSARFIDEEGVERVAEPVISSRLRGTETSVAFGGVRRVLRISDLTVTGVSAGELEIVDTESQIVLATVTFDGSGGSVFQDASLLPYPADDSVSLRYPAGRQSEDLQQLAVSVLSRGRTFELKSYRADH